MVRVGKEIDDKKTLEKVIKQRKKDMIEYNIKTFGNSASGIHGKELPKFELSKNIKEYNDKKQSSSLESSFSSIEENEKNTEIAHSKITINIDYTHDLKELIPPPNALLPHEISAIYSGKEVLKIGSNVPFDNPNCSNKEVNELNKQNNKNNEKVDKLKNLYITILEKRNTNNGDAKLIIYKDIYGVHVKGKVSLQPSSDSDYYEAIIDMKNYIDFASITTATIGSIPNLV